MSLPHSFLSGKGAELPYRPPYVTGGMKLITSVTFDGSSADDTGNSIWVTGGLDLVNGYGTITNATTYAYTELLSLPQPGWTSTATKNGVVEMEVRFTYFGRNSHIFKLGNSLGLVHNSGGTLGVIDQDGVSFENPIGVTLNVHQWYKLALVFNNNSTHTYVDEVHRASFTTNDWNFQIGVNSYGGLLIGQEPDAFNPFGGFDSNQCMRGDFRNLKVWAGT